MYERSPSEGLDVCSTSAKPWLGITALHSEMRGMRYPCFSLEVHCCRPAELTIVIRIEWESTIKVQSGPEERTQMVDGDVVEFRTGLTSGGKK